MIWGIMIAGIVFLTVLFGLFFYRTAYFRLYQEVQIFQRMIVEGEKIPVGEERDRPEDVLREGFRRIQKKYGIETEKVIEEKKAVQGLISDLSHQLKTPLSNIRLYQELLRKPDLEPERRGLLQEKLEEQTDKLDWLLNTLFQMVDLERGVVLLSKEPVDVRDILSRAIEAVLLKAEKRGIRISAEKLPDGRVICDARWTEEVFLNILENGIKYAPQGSVLHLSMECYETYASIQIRDEGPGIPKEEYGKIFQKFYRGKDARSKEGWGIGLYLSRLILEQENGYIKVESVPEEGSTFSVFLPVVPEEIQAEKI